MTRIKKTRKVYTREQKLNFIKLYNSGMSINAINEKHDIKIITLKRLLQKHKIKEPIFLTAKTYINREVKDVTVLPNPLFLKYKTRIYTSPRLYKF